MGQPKCKFGNRDVVIQNDADKSLERQVCFKENEKESYSQDEKVEISKTNKEERLFWII